VITTNFLKTGNPAFIGPALTHFNFLETDYFLNTTGIAEASETIICYENDDIKLQVVFALPEAPFVVMQRIANKRIKKQLRYKPIDKETKRLIKEYNKLRDLCSFDDWHKKLHKGDFNSLIDEIIRHLSAELRNNVPWIEFAQNS
jgi:hypothetical protein